MHKRSNKIRPPNLNLPIIVIIFIITLILSQSALAVNAHHSAETRSSRANTLPVPSFNTSSMSIFTLETLVIDASNSYDPDGTIAFYRFQFDDTEETDWVKTPVITHIYQKERFYNIRLKVMDDSGEESNYWATVTVEIKDRLPFIVIEPELTVEPDTEVTLEGYRCWDEDGHIINYTWEFEDNTTLYGPNVTHIFKDPGIYNIFLTVLDDDRKANKSSMRVIVTEPSVSKRRTIFGILAIAAVGAVGAGAIFFGRRLLPVRRKPSTIYHGGAYGIDRSEAEQIKEHITSWCKRHGDEIPAPDEMNLLEYAEPFIYSTVSSGLKDEDLPVPEMLKVALVQSKDLSDHRDIMFGAAAAGVLPAEFQTTAGIKPMQKAYDHAYKQIAIHDGLGDARYYVPRTREQETLAAFVTRKLWKHKLGDPKTFRNDFTESDKKLVRSIIELLSRCWKTAHSFKARAFNDETRLYLTLIFCEKAGKRRFGAGKTHSDDVAYDDDELELLDEMLAMFIEIWRVLQFKEYTQRPENTKIINAINTFEHIGGFRYLNDDHQGEESL